MNPWEATHPTTIEQAKEKLEQFPELAPITIRTAGTGFDHTVYTVNNQYAFRFPRRKMGFEAMETEASVLHDLSSHKLSIPIPEPRYRGKADDGDFPFVGFTYMKGHVLTDESDTNAVAPDAPRLGRFLSELHQLKVDAAALDHLDRLSVKKRKPKLKEAIHNIEHVLSRSLLDELKSYVEHVPDEENPEGQTFVHGDLHAKNIIMDQGRISGIIDWGDAHLGHPAVDLAFVYMTLQPEDRAGFFQEYGDVDLYTEKLARFRALFTSIMLLQFALDTKDHNVQKWAEAGIEKALR
ncbi:phosphotransferase [Halobacillus litoralis]|uniref:phosphotransferase n=1 Tax=Halobacillus litoralis TaxID=45668 RepID=UPI001CD359B7|nr:phosphotransferase [Halobacillus litoralis]MCA0969227.1 phosphotransferase [Halobacillus litoralis]